MKLVTLRSGEQWPSLGLGTWRLGERATSRSREITALRLAFDIGFRLVDTAEMYGEGGAEEIVGEALRAAIGSGVAGREDFIVVSKFYPQHAGRHALQAACERSLRRLKLDRLDLYLLHWRGRTPLRETIEGLQTLQQRGLIRRWGVSNFGAADMQELIAVDGGDSCAANQVYYSLGERGVEFDLLPWQQSRAMPLLAYCPLDQGRIASASALQALARRAGMDAVEVALAWVLSQRAVIAIPKAVEEAHLRQNWQAATRVLDAALVAEIDRLCPPPQRPTPLATT